MANCPILLAVKRFLNGEELHNVRRNLMSAEKKKLSGRQIKDLFYTEVKTPEDESGDTTTIFRCRCGKTRSQSLKHGYTNLSQHVLMKHPEWIESMVHEFQGGAAIAASNQQGKEKKAKKRASVSSQRNKSITIFDTEQSPTHSLVKQVENAIGDTSSITSSSRAGKSETMSEESVSSAVSTDTDASISQASSPETVVQKREGYLSWDDYFMSVAFLSAMRSKDPSTQVGACIVSPDKKIVGIGYNGFPNGCNDDDLPWAKESATGNPLNTKYPYVCHAEMNAILNKNSTDVKGCSIYVALFPCNECAKLIIQSGISRVVYYSNKYYQDWKFEASRRLLDMAGVVYVQHQLNMSQLLIDFTSIQ